MRVTVIDKLARKQYEVEPRQFEGRLLHQLPAVRTALRRCLRRALPDASRPRPSARGADPLRHARRSRTWRASQGSMRAPWTSSYLQGLIDVPFSESDARHAQRHHPRRALRGAGGGARAPLESHAERVIEAQQRAEEEQASQQSLRAIQRAFREATARAAARGVRLVRRPDARHARQGTPAARVAAGLSEAAERCRGE